MSSLIILLLSSLTTVVWAEGHPVFASSDKVLKICSVSEGLNIARLSSSQTRNLFRDAIEDVEFIREYISEAAFQGGIVGGLHTLQELNQTLDWEARDLTPQDTTVSAGLGYSDDRKDRRISRYVGLVNEPFVGNKDSDIALIDSASNIFPWIVDRRSIEDKWFVSHQNGRSSPKHRDLERLYVAAWIGTPGEAWVYYPPLTKTYPDYQPLAMGDVLGPRYNSQEEEFVQPNLPENNPERRAYFSSPYADTAVPGLSLITAQAPVYFTGEFQGHTYNNTYIASTGVDISVASMSTLLDELEDTLTMGSFAFLVNVQDFRIVAISQSTVEKIYPKLTGFEDSRVTHDTADGSVVGDRRNQTYLVSDTIHQSPVDLKNADWKSLADRVKALVPGGRDSTLLDIVLTGDTEATSHYAMFERWPDVADWSLVVFAPQYQLDHAMDVQLELDEIDLHVKEGGSTIVQSTIHNRGTLDAAIRLEKYPPWFSLVSEYQGLYTIKAGESRTLEFKAETGNIAGSASSLVAYTIADDEYPDCFFEQLLTVKISMTVLHEADLHQLDTIRPYGFALAGIVVLSAVACSVWVIAHRSHLVVRASQPIFLHILCAGILTMGLSIVPMGIDDSLASDRGCTIACNFVPWLLSMGFSIAFAALYSKIWRINQIVKACRNYQRVNLKPRHVLVPFFCIFTLNVVVLTLWTAIDPLVWVRESRDDDKNSYGSCSFQGHAASISFAASLLAINFLALVLALVELYRARNISMEYSESKYIAIAIGSNLQVFLTGLPILVLVNDSPQLLYFVKSSLVFVLAMSMLLLIFVPKMLMVRHNVAPSVLGSSVQGSKQAVRGEPPSIESRGDYAHRSVDPYQPSTDFGRSAEDDTMYSSAERHRQSESRHHSTADSPTGRKGDPQKSVFSSLTESAPPSQFDPSGFDSSVGLESIEEDDMTNGSSKFWRAKFPKKSSRSAGAVPREPSISEDSASPNRPALRKSNSSENAPSKPSRVASISEHPHDSFQSEATLSCFNGSNATPSERQMSEVEYEKEITKSLHSNAAKPERLVSDAESVTIDYGSSTESQGSIPGKSPSEVDSLACGSVDPPNHASKPVRLPSVVEAPVEVETQNLLHRPTPVAALPVTCTVPSRAFTRSTQNSEDSPV